MIPIIQKDGPEEQKEDALEKAKMTWNMDFR
jgi:hypothetical protein